MDRALAICAEAGGVCPDGPVLRDEGERGSAATATTYKASFFQAPYLQSALVSLGAIVDTFETACTWDRFESLHAAIQAGVMAAMQRVGNARRAQAAIALADDHLRRLRAVMLAQP